MRVIAYCRVSTADQSDNGVSLDAQQAKTNGYASLYELEVVETIIDASSGKTLAREGLQRALALLRANKADGLLIVKLDRLTRSVADWQVLIDEYFGEKAGKQLFSVADCIDTPSSGGRLVLNVLLCIAQWEREAIGERTREALQHKIRNNERVGKVKYGFDLADDGVNLTPNPIEQTAVALMHELRAAGQTLRQIASELTARGISTKEGRSRWSHSAVSYILNREA
jgi:site-specific DNA recombinase